MALDILYILSDSGIKFRPHLNLENADVWLLYAEVSLTVYFYCQEFLSTYCRVYLRSLRSLNPTFACHKHGLGVFL